MALTVSAQAKWWSIGLAIVVVIMWFLSDVLLPFVAGAAIAYLLDPVADRLQRAGCSRVIATLIISLFALFVFILSALILIPALIEQLAALVAAAPQYSAQLQVFLQEQIPSLMEPESPLRRTLEGIGEKISRQGGELANAFISSVSGVINAVIFIVIVPVVAFYMLLDWDRMVAVVDNWLPRDHAPVLRKLASDVDKVLAGFVRGQVSVMGILGVFYAVSLMAVGLQFGLVVGFIAGLMSFIPYVGAVFGGLLSIGLALFQFWDSPWLIGAVALIFVIGQVAEGNILTPKLVGGSVGLHPVWLMFALSAFGALFGFTGLLIAVPVAASLGVFFRFGVNQYLGGALYQGGGQKDDAG